MKLLFTSDHMPGYRRIRKGKGFAYILPDGTSLIDHEERKRISSLAVPPAYTNVWICTLPNGHLQATGVDARGRKQYRYHPEWHESAADRKFTQLPDFALALPRIRAAIKSEMAKTSLSRDRVVAGVVALLDLTGYRIGNARYVKENNTFGLSSLLTEHLHEAGGRITLHFRGKAGLQHHAEISHPRLARLVSDLQELPGQHLFRYEDESDVWHDIDTADVNEWIKRVGNGDYTAKQFRTWRATVLCARELAKHPPEPGTTRQRRTILTAIKATAVRFNHTPATCRKYYVHPAIIQSYLSGALYETMNSKPPRLRKSDGSAHLHSEERRVLKLIHPNQKKARFATHDPCR